MNNSCKVSILVPIYGTEKYIERCTRSLFEQTYSNIEFVFVNDCTPDRSVEILKSILEKYPQQKSNTKIISHDKNRGVATARNTLLDNATGDYVMWVDSDDYIDKNAVKILIQKVVQTNADIICLGASKLKKSKVTPIRIQDITNPKEIIKHFLLGDILTTLWGYFIKRELFVNNTIRFVEGLDIGEDMFVLSKLAYYARTIAIEPQILYYWNSTNESSLVHNYDISKSNMELGILDLLYDFFKYDNDIIAFINERKVSSLLFNIYCTCLENNKYEYCSLKKQINSINGKNIRNTNSLLYRFFLYCNNYFINRLWAEFLSLLKTIHY